MVVPTTGVDALLVRGREIRRPGRGKEEKSGNCRGKRSTAVGEICAFSRYKAVSASIRDTRISRFQPFIEQTDFLHLPPPVFLFSPDTNPTEIYPFLSLKQERKKKKRKRRTNADDSSGERRIWNFLYETGTESTKILNTSSSQL